MACVVVWRLARDTRHEAAELRNMLIRLGGRQMKRGKKHRGFTEPALLAGLGVLIPMLLLLQEYDGVCPIVRAAVSFVGTWLSASSDPIGCFGTALPVPSSLRHCRGPIASPGL